MKGLTLTQPWASLVAVGAKQVETRSWRSQYRGPLAIHAAKGLGPVGGRRGLAELCAEPVFANALYDPADPYTRIDRRLPLGAIVAVCELVEIVETGRANFALRVLGLDLPEQVERECAFGDFTPGRFAWLLGEVRAVEPLELARGAVSDYRGVWQVPTSAARRLRGAR